MENKFTQYRTALDKAETCEEVQDLIFQIAEEKIEVARQSDGLIVYAETSYLHQLERYANRRINELGKSRFGYLNLFFIETRRIIDRDIFNLIKENTFGKMNNNN